MKFKNLNKYSMSLFYTTIRINVQKFHFMDFLKGYKSDIVINEDGWGLPFKYSWTNYRRFSVT